MKGMDKIKRDSIQNQNIHEEDEEGNDSERIRGRTINIEG